MSSLAEELFPMKRLEVIINSDKPVFVGNPNGSTVLMISLYCDSVNKEHPYAELSIASSSLLGNGDIENITWEKKVIGAGDCIMINIGDETDGEISTPLEIQKVSKSEKQEAEYKYFLKLKQRFDRAN
jgi:hypothetical protein